MFVSSISNHHEQQKHVPIIHNYDDIIDHHDHDQDQECPPASSLMLMKEGKRSWKSNNEIAPNCPRCASSNTKFCYYNNYSLSQPRYFCKGCRRYWTKGGSLRNVPVGGGCRKSRRSIKSARGGGLNNNKYQLIPSPAGSSSTTTSDGNNNNTSDGSNIDLAAVFAKFLNQDSNNDEDNDYDKVFLNDQEFSSGGTTTSSASPPEMMMPLDHMSGDDYIHQMENILFESPHDEQLIQSSDLLVDDFGYYSIGGTCNFYYDDQPHNHTGVLNIIPQADDEDDQNLLELHDHDHPLLMEEFEGILRGDDHHEDNQNNNNNNNFMGWMNTSNLPNLDMQNIVQFQDLVPFSIDDHQAAQFVPNIVACEDWSSFDLSGY